MSCTSSFNVDIFLRLVKRLSGLGALRGELQLMIVCELMRRQMIALRLSLKPGLINLLSVWALCADSNY